MSENNSEKDLKEKQSLSAEESKEILKDYQVRSIVGGKLFDYKSRLKSKKLSLFSVEESEQHRREADELYQSIIEMPTRLLDGRLYNFFIMMQKKRDLQFLQEKSTPSERIKRLGRFMLRLSTPILFLNHNHNIQISYPNKIEYNEQSEEKLNSQNDFTLSTDIITPIMSQDELNQAKKTLKEKLINRKDWVREELNEFLSHNEADLLSQMLSSEDELIMFVNDELIRFYLTKNTKKLNKKLKSYVYMLEPRKNTK